MAEEAVEETTKKKKKGKKLILIPVVALLLGLGGGGYFLTAGKKADASHGAEGEHGATTTTVALGKVVRLAPITMNLSDGHVLKVGIALQTVEKPKHHGLAAALAGGAHAAKPTEESPLGGEEAMALDEAIHYLGDSTYAALSAPGGRAKARHELAEKIKHIYHGDVTDIYFTAFVMS